MTQPPDETPRLPTDATGYPALPHVPTGAHNDLGEPDAPEEHGRVGYGRLGKYTPFGLALVIILVLVAIGISQARSDSTDEAGIPLPGTPQVGTLAPDVSLTQLDGTTVQLSSLRGSVVMVNFWASWCDYCIEEIPELIAVDGTAAPGGALVRVMGVGVTPDTDSAARRMATDLGIDYIVGRDTGDSGPAPGPIQTAFDVADYIMPATVFIAPDGMITRVKYGPMTDEMIEDYVDEAVD